MRDTVSGMEIRWCAECKDDQAFEVPPCADGHGADCLDLACVECGFAIVVGLQEIVLLPELAVA